jgi:hypothetical protein
MNSDKSIHIFLKHRTALIKWCSNNVSILIVLPSIFNPVKDIQQKLVSSFLLFLLIPLHVSASRYHLQRVKISLFISYSKLSAFLVGVGYFSSGVAICCGMRPDWYIIYKVQFYVGRK